jgi:hypothetical protein
MLYSCSVVLSQMGQFSPKEWRTQSHRRGCQSIKHNSWLKQNFVFLPGSRRYTWQPPRAMALTIILLPWIVSLLMIGNFFGCILLLLHTFKIVRENKLMWWVEFSKQYFSEVHRRECDVLCDRNCLRDAYIWVQLVSGSVWLGVKTLAGSNYVLGGISWAWRTCACSLKG